jgi:hypothetical protein
LDFIKKKVEDSIKDVHTNYQFFTLSAIDDKEIEKYFDQFTRCLLGKPLTDEKKDIKSPFNSIFKLFKGGNSGSGSSSNGKSIFSPLIPSSESDAPSYSPRVRLNSAQQTTTDSNQIGKDWKVRKKLGQGGAGKIYLVEHLPTKKIYVMKRVKLDDLNDLNGSINK